MSNIEDVKHIINFLRDNEIETGHKRGVEPLEEMLKELDRLQKELDKKDKVIDLMAEHIFKNSNNLAEYFCNGIPENICEARGNTEESCRYCIKLYFYKQVEVEDDNSTSNKD